MNLISLDCATKVDYFGGLHAVRLFPKSGYAIAVQDVRGRHGSEGEFTLYEHAVQDGWDALDWLAQQSWSSGRIGTFGCSAPVATLGGPHCCTGDPDDRPGSFDQALSAQRDDVLVFHPEVMSNSLLIVGPLRARLNAATTAADIDFQV